MQRENRSSNWRQKIRAREVTGGDESDLMSNDEGRWGQVGNAEILALVKCGGQGVHLESARVNQGGFYQRCQVDVQIW